jgi:hypothetical protein
MSKHKFGIGQEVYFQPGKIGMPATLSKYIVLRQMPLDGGERKYRIKSEEERFERVARESEIAGAAEVLVATATGSHAGL